MTLETIKFYTALTLIITSYTVFLRCAIVSHGKSISEEKKKQIRKIGIKK